MLVMKMCPKLGDRGSFMKADSLHLKTGIRGLWSRRVLGRLGKGGVCGFSGTGVRVAAVVRVSCINNLDSGVVFRWEGRGNISGGVGGRGEDSLFAGGGRGNDFLLGAVIWPFQILGGMRIFRRLCLAPNIRRLASKRSAERLLSVLPEGFLLWNVMKDIKPRASGVWS